MQLINSLLLNSCEIAAFNATEEPIYCVMVTGKCPERVPLARNAIRCFLQQSYPNRHLIIIDDSKGENVSGIGAPFQIGHFQVDGPAHLGSLRNHALDVIPEDRLVCQWDDDDWHAPTYLEEQYAFLSKQRLDGCAASSQLKYSLITGRGWVHELPLTMKGFAGAILARNKAHVRYPAWRAHEDSAYWATYTSKHQTAAWNNPAALYIRFIHSFNTSEHLGHNANPNEGVPLDIQSMELISSILSCYNSAVQPAKDVTSAN